LRLFVALMLGARWGDALTDVQRRVRRHDPRSGVRWVDAANIHLTLRFLGEVEAATVAPLVTAFARAIAGAAPPVIAPAALGAFPTPRRPRVIWVGITETGLRLDALHTRVEAAVGDLGWQAETRPFHPHLTLGRVRDPRRVSPEFSAGLATEPVPTWEPGPVTRVALVRSHLSTGGARHEALQVWQLA